VEQNRGGDGPAVGELTSSDLTPCGLIMTAGDDAAGYRETTRAATRRDRRDVASKSSATPSPEPVPAFPT